MGNALVTCIPRSSPEPVRDMGTKILLLVLSVAVAGIAMMWSDIKTMMGYAKTLTFNDNSCKLLHMPTPAEDLSVYDDHSAFAGGGDIWNTFSTGSATAVDGGLWLVNASDGTIRELPIANRPPGKLILHGIYFSRQTSRLYAVNHDAVEGESVEVFGVSQESGELKVSHIASVRSPFFGVNTLNDVVEGVDGEFYVSEWQAFSFPKGGTHNPDNSLTDKLGRAAQSTVMVMKYPMTRVFRCSIDEGCTVASSQRFMGANGLAVSEDRQTVYVNDPGAGMLYVMTRAASGELVTASEFKTKHMFDNIEVQGDQISGGSIPLPFSMAVVCEDMPQLSWTRVVDGREVACGKSPGGLTSISLTSEGSVGDVQEDVLIHDGSLLSGVSAALKLGGKVMMGSPISPGVLMCG